MTHSYRETRQQYLRQVLASYSQMLCDIEVNIITDEAHQDKIKLLETNFPLQSHNFQIKIVSFPNLPHPWLLTWGHKQVFKQKFNDLQYTHFICSEDDIEVRKNNIDYWLEHRQRLEGTGFYPSFLRVEYNSIFKSWRSTDLTENIILNQTPVLTVDNRHYSYLNLKNPYQGIFMYDRILMKEHMQSDTFDILKYGGIETLDMYPGWGGGRCSGKG